jgi:transcriptional regulator GlxA family with amidase domain
MADSIGESHPQLSFSPTSFRFQLSIKTEWHPQNVSTDYHCNIHVLTGKPAAIPLNYGVLVFPGFQAGDVFGPLDILNSLSWDKKMTLAIIASTMEPVTTQVDMPAVNIAGSFFGQTINPTHTFANPPKSLDVLIVPGGFGTHAAPPALLDAIKYIQDIYPTLQYLLSVCSGGRLLARAGLLKGKRATTNKESFAEIAAMEPEADWIPSARWVADGKLWTCSGASAGMDGTYGLVEHIYDKETADKLANLLEYERHSDPSWDPFAVVWSAPRASAPVTSAQ